MRVTVGTEMVCQTLDNRLTAAALRGALVGVAGSLAGLDGDNTRFAQPTAGQIADATFGCPDLVGGCVVLKNVNTFTTKESL